MERNAAMIRLSPLWIALAMSAAAGPLDSPPAPPRGSVATYRVQLVRATDADHAPSAGARQLGSAEIRPLRPLFRWTHYWEVSHREVCVDRGKVGTVEVSPSRTVQIDLTEPGKRRVTALENGKRVSTLIRPSGEASTILGGYRDPGSAWFVVVSHAPAR
ncbi:MAG TPA: hypothetical protein DCM86_04580 [Verrucomicrobiales bacterium]|nr:hypothetical protein [Verrucomicrobiales bacterium]